MYVGLSDRKSGEHRVAWVRCVEHGNEFEATLSHLKSGHTTTCRRNKPCYLHEFISGRVIPGTDLKYVGLATTTKPVIVRVRCRKHGNKFEAAAV